MACILDSQSTKECSIRRKTMKRNMYLASPNFLGISASNCTVMFGPNPAWTPIFTQFGSRLTTSQRLRRSSGRSELALAGDLRSLRDVVKRLPNWLKIGVQAGFGPNFTMEFEAGIPKKFGLAYCIVCPVSTWQNSCCGRGLQ